MATETEARLEVTPDLNGWQAWLWTPYCFPRGLGTWSALHDTPMQPLDLARDVLKAHRRWCDCTRIAALEQRYGGHDGAGR